MGSIGRRELEPARLLPVHARAEIFSLLKDSGEETTRVSCCPYVPRGSSTPTPFTIQVVVRISPREKLAQEAVIPNGRAMAKASSAPPQKGGTPET